MSGNIELKPEKILQGAIFTLTFFLMTMISGIILYKISKMVLLKSFDLILLKIQ